MLNTQNNLLLNQSRQLKDLAMTAFMEFKSYVIELIKDKAKYEDGFYNLNFDDLSLEEKSKLASLRIKDNEYDATGIFYRLDKFAKEDEITLSLLDMLESPDKALSYAEKVRQHAINYFAEDIQNELEYYCDELSRTNPYE